MVRTRSPSSLQRIQWRVRATSARRLSLSLIDIFLIDGRSELRFGKWPHPAEHPTRESPPKSYSNSSPVRQYIRCASLSIAVKTRKSRERGLMYRYEVMVRCWDENPARRPDFAAIVETIEGMVEKHEKVTRSSISRPYYKTLNCMPMVFYLLSTFALSLNVGKKSLVNYGETLTCTATGPATTGE